MDAFAGLAWDDSKTQNPKNVTLGAQQQRQMTPSTLSKTSTASSSVDSFGKLAAAGQFQPITPSISPSPINPISSKPSSVGAVPISSNRGNGFASPPRPSGGVNANGDPFGGLFAYGGSPNINMSMADRRAHAERERRERERREKEQLEAQGAMWDQLDGALSSTNASNANSRTGSPSPAILSLGNRSHVANSPPAGLKTNPGLKRTTSPKSNSDLFWSMHQSLSSTPSRTASPGTGKGAGQVPQRAPSLPKMTPLAQSEPVLSSPSTDILSPLSQRNDAWAQLDALVAPKPAPAVATSNVAASMDPFDLDFLSDSPTAPNASTSNAAISANPTPPRSRSRTPGNFDFGEREDLGSGSGTEDDDILGELAKPVEHLSVEDDHPPTPRASTTTFSRPSQASRSVSPPPHVIGQIVEMGFTPQQARQALASTETGLDVQAALNSLLNMGEDIESADLSHMHDSGWPTHDEPSPPPPSARTRDTASLRETSAPNANPKLNDTINGLANQLQADKLLAQASEIGLSMFSKANAFWNQGKEVVQKAYEERTKPGQPGNSGTPNAGDGRPKWMTADAGIDNDHDRDVGRSSGRRKSEFRDDDDVREHDSRERVAASARSTQRRQSANTNTPLTNQPTPKQANAKLLFDDEAPSYISPHRRRPTPSNSRSDLAPSPQPSRSVAPSPRPPPQQQQRQQQAPPAPPTYAIPETSPAAIASSISARTKGTEHFKLGRYADAEACYSNAISSLPDTHVLLTSLYTNRAAARLKTGDSGGAVSDCTTSLKLMGVGESLSGLLDVEDGQVRGLKFDGVPNKLDLREQAVKALQRRATGFELMERWERARADWERLAGLGWAQAQGKIREEATRSAVRCRSMVNAQTGGDDPSSTSLMPGSQANPQPKPKPRPKPRPTMRSRAIEHSEGAQRLRAAEAAQEAEDNERIQVKDSVDARIQAWKGGKEANVRALIASLETVLWPELNWVKVGMHELVTPNQVKIRYTKAIAKVHPDKLKTGNTTVEQRMIANGVFAGLNEAWGAFKQ